MTKAEMKRRSVRSMSLGLIVGPLAGLGAMIANMPASGVLSVTLFGAWVGVSGAILTEAHNA